MTGGRNLISGHIIAVVNNIRSNTNFKSARFLFGVYTVANTLHFLFRLKNESSHAIQSLNQSLGMVSKPAEEHTIKEQQKYFVPSQRSITIEDLHSQHRVSNNAERGTSTSLRHSETSIQPKLSRTTGLTRTTRKAYFGQKKTPFASFGWNDSNRNIGQKKTYNVYAPESEVRLMKISFIAIQQRLLKRYYYSSVTNPHTSFHCAEGTLK
jgi:hypothetical protein